MSDQEKGLGTAKPISEMNNDEFHKHVIVDGLQGWIPVKTYLRLFSEESKVGIDSRIKRGHWRKGVHYNTPRGANMWVNVIAIGKWAARDPDEVQFATKAAADTLGG